MDVASYTKNNVHISVYEPKLSVDTEAEFSTKASPGQQTPPSQAKQPQIQTRKRKEPHKVEKEPQQEQNVEMADESEVIAPGDLKASGGNIASAHRSTATPSSTMTNS